MTPAELFESNLGLAYQLARRFHPVSGVIDRDDLLQAALLGLWQAAGRWRPDVGASFATFAERRIRGAMIDEFRRSRQGRRSMWDMARSGALEIDHVRVDVDDLRRRTTAVSLHKAIGRDEDLTYMDTIGEEDSAYEKLEDEDEAADVIAGLIGLPDRLRLVMWLYHVEELTLREIGEVLGVSQSRVCQLVKRAEERARRMLLKAA